LNGKIVELENYSIAKSIEVDDLKNMIVGASEEKVSANGEARPQSKPSYAAVAAKLVTPGTCGEIIAAELADRDKRKNNLLVFNVEESSSENPTDRKQADTARVDSLLTHLSVKEEVSRPIQVCVRIGTYKKTDDGRVRPVLIKLRNQMERDIIMAKAYK